MSNLKIDTPDKTRILDKTQHQKWRNRQIRRIFAQLERSDGKYPHGKNPYHIIAKLTGLDYHRVWQIVNYYPDLVRKKPTKDE